MELTVGFVMRKPKAAIWSSSLSIQGRYKNTLAVKDYSTHYITSTEEITCTDSSHQYKKVYKPKKYNSPTIICTVNRFSKYTHT